MKERSWNNKKSSTSGTEEMKKLEENKIKLWVVRGVNLSK